MKKVSKKELKNLVYQVIGAAIEVHKVLGPGLLESVYHQCLLKELELRNIKYISEYPLRFVLLYPLIAGYAQLGRIGAES